MSEDKPQGSHSGRGVVLTILAIAVVAGIFALVFRRGASSPPAVGDHDSAPAGSATFDRVQARDDLTDAEVVVHEAISHNNHQLAVAEAKALVEKYPLNFAPARRLYAQALIAAGKTLEGYQQLEMCLEMDPRQPSVHTLAGAAANELGHLDVAVHHYALAIGMEPKSVRARLALAQIYLKKQDFRQAQRLVLEVLQLDSASHQGYKTLSDIHREQHLYHMALDDLDKAIQATPLASRDIKVGYMIDKAALLRDQLQRPQDALLVLTSLRPRERLEPRVVEQMALCTAARRGPERAAGEYEQLMLADPTDWHWAAGAARWRLAAGDKPAAIAHLEMLKQLNGDPAVIAELEAKLR